jgi:hypothetical protein
MIPELSVTAMTYAMADRFLDALVGDFTDADWQVADANGHTARWITGHLAVYRHQVAALLGAEPGALPWEAAFVRGTSSADVPADLDPRLLVASFHASQAAMAGRWEAVGAADLARPYGRTLPDGTDTAGGAIRFMTWHEAYHLGQLGFMRRLAGKPGRA